jgi:hypothetical protein
VFPEPDHGCPVEGNRLFTMIHTQPKIPLAGLDPAIHVFLGLDDLGGQDVDTRTKSGQSVLRAKRTYSCFVALDARSRVVAVAQSDSRGA